MRLHFSLKKSSDRHSAWRPALAACAVACLAAISGEQAEAGSGVNYSGCCIMGPNGCEENFMCQTTAGDMASSSDVSSMNSSVNQAIETFGKNISAQINTQTSQNATAMTALSQQETSMFQKLLSAWEAARYTYETTGASGSMYNACGQGPQAQSVAKAISTRNATNVALFAAQQQRNTTPVSTAAAIAALAQTPPRQLSASALFATDDAPATLPSGQDINTYIGILTNPLPTPRLNSAQASNKGAAMAWRAMDNNQRNAMSAAQLALSGIAASQLPPAQGQLSEDGLMQKAASAHMADYGWVDWVDSAGEPAIVKDIATMGAISLAQQRQSIALLQNLAVLTAQDYAQRMTAQPEAVSQIENATAQARSQSINP